MFAGGLGLALLLNQRLPGRAFFRAAYFLPVVTSWVVVALVWKWLLNPTNGLVNSLLGALGRPQPGWWTDPTWALPAVILASAWKDLGFVMVIMLAGLQAIPQDILRGRPHRRRQRLAAVLAGHPAAAVPSTFFVVVISLINGFQVFDQVYVMTGGGPSGASQVVVGQIYDLTFRYGRAGEASALSWILFAVILRHHRAPDARPTPVGALCVAPSPSWRLRALSPSARAIMLVPFLWTVITSITPTATWPAARRSFVKTRRWPPTGSCSTRCRCGGSCSTRSGSRSPSTAVPAGHRRRWPRTASPGWHFRGKGIVFGFYLATLMVPLQVLVVPLFIEMKTLNLQDTYLSLLAPSIASAFGVFLLRQAVESVPRDLDEAATIDGAGHLRIFTTIVLPLIRPALATVAVFAFMGSWNSFLWPLVVIRSPEFMTLPLGLSTLQGQFTTDWDVVMAGSVFSIVPIAIVYLLAQRHIIAGIAHTGIK